jgi:hypothetical protein
LYGEEEAWVKSRLELISLSEEGRDALRDGKIKVTAAVKLAKLSAEQQRKALRDAEAHGGRVTGAAIQAASGKPRKPNLADLRTVLQQISEDGKIPESLTFERGPKDTTDDVLAAFCAAVLKYLSGKQAA